MKQIKVVLLAVFLWSALPAWAMSPALEAVISELKSSVATLDDATFRQAVARHYQTLRLLDANGEWVSPELHLISEQLLPSHLRVADALALLDRMAEHAEENPYMVEFFERASHKPFQTLFSKVESEGYYTLPAVVAYAVLQENLTQAMYDDYRLIETLMSVWVPVRQALGIEAGLDTFSKMKLASVEKPMRDYVSFHQTRVIPADYGKLDLPMNIFEAVAEDLSVDRRENAKAGAVLAFHLPGQQPARFSDDGKAVLLTMPAPKAWADLYSIWNMAFVSHFSYFPFVMVKLMIPQVNNIAEQPEAYIYNRSLALYTHLHFSFIGQFDMLMAGRTPMDWYDPKLTQLLGHTAYKSAKHYKSLVNDYED